MCQSLVRLRRAEPDRSRDGSSWRTVVAYLWRLWVGRLSPNACGGFSGRAPWFPQVEGWTPLFVDGLFPCMRILCQMEA